MILRSTGTSRATIELDGTEGAICRIGRAGINPRLFFSSRRRPGILPTTRPSRDSGTVSTVTVAFARSGGRATRSGVVIDESSGGCEDCASGSAAGSSGARVLAAGDGVISTREALPAGLASGDRGTAAGGGAGLGAGRAPGWRFAGEGFSMGGAAGRGLTAGADTGAEGATTAADGAIGSVTAGEGRFCAVVVGVGCAVCCAAAAGGLDVDNRLAP